MAPNQSRRGPIFSRLAVGAGALLLANTASQSFLTAQPAVRGRTA
eukprot:CAMPEP_0195105966 /NCGR_PEP_ID=MMETSP0448-20130528/78756_1 /TAXON_ID=66468 /ORGANISM="Heterocapsa triquestra, Strain CCMP 448" /LENGTH=44 /DNA_ID= /DNA_START= /DNA_END= /DNA_ORIENTATION=